MRFLPASIALSTVTFIAMSCGSSGGGTGGSGGGTDSSTSSLTSTSSGACVGVMQMCMNHCVDITTDTKNCGSCGHECAMTSLCCNGACIETPTCSFGPMSVEPKQGFLNGGDWVTIHGDGFAAPVKVFLGDGRAPARVVDAQTILIQTPPGVPGAVDVKVVQGAKTATLQYGFKYTTAGLNIPWEQKPMMTVRGEDPGVATMQDGRVLIAGGSAVPDSTKDALATAEIYTRNTDTVTAAATPMSTPRWQNSAITLMSGKVLVVGGACHYDLMACVGDATAADLFDPATNSFTPTKNKLSTQRVYTRAVMLGDGRVLVSSANNPNLEVYDPEKDTFTVVPSMSLHIFGFMVRLRDGRALVGGGDGGNKTAEIFDPDTNTLTPTGTLTIGRSMLTAHTLPDGRVLLIGGASQSAGGILDPLDSTELYDPKTGMFTAAPWKLSIGRCWHASALVRDGTILVMGGYTIHGQCSSSSNTVDQIDPVQNTVMPFAMLPNANTEWVAVTLLDGSVLGVGGGACGTSMALPDLDFLPGAMIPN